MSIIDDYSKFVFAKGRQMGKTEMTRMTIPLIRKVFPKLMAEELVGVQPMEGVNYGKIIEALKIIDQTNKFIEFFKEEEFTIE